MPFLYWILINKKTNNNNTLKGPLIMARWEYFDYLIPPRVKFDMDCNCF